MNTQVFGGLLGLLAGGAAAFSPDEAEAAPRPKYMEELVAKLKSRDFETGMNFGEYSARDLKKKVLKPKALPPGLSNFLLKILPSSTTNAFNRII